MRGGVLFGGDFNDVDYSAAYYVTVKAACKETRQETS